MRTCRRSQNVSWINLGPMTPGINLSGTSELRGFGIRIKRKSGASSYLVNYRTPEGRQRRYAFAKAGTLTPDEARKIARTHLAAIATGADPSAVRHEARQTLTVGDLCDRYMEAADAGLVITRFGRPKRASTIKIDRGRVARHIKPCIGQLPLTKLCRADIQRMVDRITQGKTGGQYKTKSRGKAVVRGGAGTAARVVEFFGGIWTWAEGHGLVSGVSPVRGVRRAARGTKERILSASELAALGRVLDEKKLLQPDATAAVQLLPSPACDTVRHVVCGERKSSSPAHVFDSKTQRPDGRRVPWVARHPTYFGHWLTAVTIRQRFGLKTAGWAARLYVTTSLTARRIPAPADPRGTGILIGR